MSDNQVFELLLSEVREIRKDVTENSKITSAIQAKLNNGFSEKLERIDNEVHKWEPRHTELTAQVQSLAEAVDGLGDRVGELEAQKARQVNWSGVGDFIKKWGSIVLIVLALAAAAGITVKNSGQIGTSDTPKIEKPVN